MTKDWRLHFNSLRSLQCAAIWLLAVYTGGATLAESTHSPAPSAKSLVGVVQYVDPDAPFALVVNGSKATRVQLSSSTELRVGQQVQLDVVAAADGVQLEACHILEPSRQGVWLPEPIAREVKEASKSERHGAPIQVESWKDAQQHTLVQLTATVLQAFTVNQRTRFDMVDRDGSKFQLVVGAAPESRLAASVVGRTVAVSGVAERAAQSPLQQTLYAGSFDVLRGQGAGLNEAIMVDGVVIGFSDSELILENDEQRWLLSHRGLGCSAGQQLETWSRVDRDGKMQLLSAMVMGQTPLPEPKIRSPREVLAGLDQLERVRLDDAEVVSREDLAPGITQLHLKKDRCEFTAELSWTPETVRPGQQVSVAGVPLLQHSADENIDAAFRILPVDPKDLVVLTPAPIHNSWGPMVFAAFIVLGGGGVSIVWSRFVGATTARTMATTEAQLRACHELISGETGVVIANNDNRIASINTRARTLLEANEFVGEEISQLLGMLVQRSARPERILMAMTEIAHDPCSRHQLDLTLDNDAVLHVITVPILPETSAASPAGRVWLFHDQSEQRQLETELQRAYKLEALGTLSSSIAHDFNNSLHVVLSNLAILEQVPSNSDEGRLRLRSARHSVDRAEKVLRQLLTFTRGGELQREVIATNDLLEDSQPLRRTFFDGNVEFRFELGDDVPNVAVDVAMLEQVLLNLCINARDAMPGGGTVTFRTSSVEQSGGLWAAIDVADTGEGISPENLTNVFHPFFSTKAPDRGTGLGLTSSVSIVKRHGGEVTCESVVGEGSTFRILLPADSREPGCVLLPPNWSPLRGEGTILLVDDDDDLRFATEQLMERFGYDVVSALCVEDACQFLQKDSADLVLMDFGRGRESGWDGVEAIRQLVAAPVIMWSGYALEPAIQELSEECKPDVLLRKPTPPEKLLKLIHELLQASTSRGVRAAK